MKHDVKWWRKFWKWLINESSKYGTIDRNGVDVFLSILLLELKEEFEKLEEIING